jgi:hypothetical protein
MGWDAPAMGEMLAAEEVLSLLLDARGCGSSIGERSM